MSLHQNSAGTRLRLIAVLSGLLAAGITFALVSLHHVAACGSATCGVQGLLAVRHWLQAVVLPFAIGYVAALRVLAFFIQKKKEKM